jgi:hypothetical protein
VTDTKRLRYLDLTVKSHTGKRKAIEMIIKESDFTVTVEEMAEIVFTPTKEEQLTHIQQHRLTCDRCNTNEHLVAVPVVLSYVHNSEGDLTDNVEYYCANPDRLSPIFSKCWNHAQSYENRKGDNELTQIQEMV